MLWVFASGKDITPVAETGVGTVEGYIKSIGNSSTFPRDLVNNDDIKTAFYVLGESVSARLREAGFEARTVQIHVRPNDLSSFDRQAKLNHPTFVTGELVDTAMKLFVKNYPWHTPLRSIGIRGADLLPIGRAVQLSFFDDMVQLEKRMKWEYAIDYIRNRFGYFSIQRGYLMQDKHLSNLDAKKDNTIHPIGYQYVI